jgi:S-adenosylmethionine uptake transporter
MQMPLANVTAILQVLPLTVTLAGAVWFREAVGWRRMLSILIGFVGVLLIVRPGPEGFNTFALYAVVAVFFITLRDLSTRRMSDEVPSLLVTVCASVGVMAFGLVGTIGQEWVAVTQLGAMKLGAATLFLVIGSLTSVMMMRVGDVSFVAPFRYTGIVFALVIGFVVFGDWPDLVTLIGAGIVVASGVFTLLREGHLKRQEKRARM